MRLHITKTTSGTMTVLHIDGELVGEGVRELERAATVIHPLRIDLTNLLRANASGLAMLQRLAATEVELVNAPPYFALLLEQTAKDP